MKSIESFLKSALSVLLLTGATFASMAQSSVELLRDRAPDKRPAMLVLGTAHFNNPGRDLVNSQVDDMLSDRRQKEIVDLVEQLSAFKPTHVVIEFPKSNQEKLDNRYRDYREGRYQLSLAEEDQIGLRLAAKLRLPRVHAADWNLAPPGDEKHYDFPSYAKTHGQQPLFDAIVKPNDASSVQLSDKPISTWLLDLNRPDTLAASHRVYFDIARIGDAADQPGANWVGHWYARNLRIFNNLVELTSSPSDRILVIYGQGHAYLLRDFARESGAFRVVDVSEVVKSP